VYIHIYINTLHSARTHNLRVKTPEHSTCFRLIGSLLLLSVSRTL